MSDQPHLRLISYDTCPYVERSRIVLEEKGLDYEITFIDLRNKPDWFLEISPRGKVPVLVVDDRPIFESSVINEYLEEAFPSPSLFPKDPVGRAQARSWVVFANDVLMPALGGLFWAKPGDVESIEAATKESHEVLGRVEAELQQRGTPFMCGESFGLVDAVYTPIFSRLEALRQMGRGAAFDGLPAVKAYGELLIERPSAIAARAENLTQKTVGDKGV